MKKTIAAILAVLALLGLSACARGLGGETTPGNLNTDGQQSPLHESTGETDVSGEFAERLCRCPWMDTNTMNCYLLAEDGTYIKKNQDQTEALASGSWRLCRDEQGYLALYLSETLYLSEGAEETQTAMRELELYEQSIYAYGEAGEIYIWLLVDEAE